MWFVKFYHNVVNYFLWFSISVLESRILSSVFETNFVTKYSLISNMFLMIARLCSCESSKKYQLQHGVTATVEPAINNKKATPLFSQDKSILRKNGKLLHRFLFHNSKWLLYHSRKFIIPGTSVASSFSSLVWVQNSHSMYNLLK